MYLFRIDKKRCIGCRTCVAACMDENDLDPSEGIWFRQVTTTEKADCSCAGHITLNNVSLSCMHCSVAKCMEICPAAAITKRADGVVVVDTEACIGCKACFEVCPFGVPQFGFDGKMRKCNACLARLEEGRQPACVEACPMGALEFVPKTASETTTIWFPLIVNSDPVIVERGGRP